MNRKELDDRVNSIHIPNADEILASMDKPKVHVLPDYLVLENICCTGADGKVFEQYSMIGVMKDIVRDADNSPRGFTTYKAAAHFEKEKKFSPSFALSCNIVAALFEAGVEKQSDGGYKVLDEDINKVLMQYKSHTENYSGIHRQNTFIDWKKRKIIHYPSDSDFTSAGGNENINTGKRKSLGFNVKDFGDMELEEALKSSEYEKFIKNLSGLKNPELLVEIGNYFGKPAMVWVPNASAKCKDTRAAWLGCVNDNFYINTCNDLSNDNAVRGVFLASEASLTGGNTSK